MRDFSGEPHDPSIHSPRRITESAETGSESRTEPTQRGTARSQPSQREAARLALIRGEAYLQHFRELSNLSIQETRLRRRRERDTAALVELQRKRQEVERKAALASQPTGRPAMTYAPEPAPSNFGFEFSSDGIDAETRQLNADYRELMRIVERRKLHA